MKKIIYSLGLLAVIGCNKDKQHLEAGAKMTPEKATEEFSNYVDSVRALPAEQRTSEWNSIDAVAYERYEPAKLNLEVENTGADVQKKYKVAMETYSNLAANASTAMKLSQWKQSATAPPINVINALKTLGLSKEFIERTVLTDAESSNTLKGISELMGKVYKKVKDGNVEKYVYTGLRFVKESHTVVPEEPTNGIIFKDAYTRRRGAGLSYLVGNITYTDENAYELLVTDIAKASVLDSNINLEDLNYAYGSLNTNDEYVIIMNATCTSIAYKEYKNKSARVGVNFSGIGVDGNFYSSSDKYNRGWQVSITPAPVKEILRRYKATGPVTAVTTSPNEK